MDLPVDRIRTGQSDSVTSKRAILSFISDDLPPRQNLGSYVTSEVDLEAEQLFLEGAKRNLACEHEYQRLTELRGRCIKIIANLWHLKFEGQPTGAAASGSSEAIFLAIRALKERWLRQNDLEECEAARAPNLIICDNCHVAVINGAASCNVTCKTVHVSAATRYVFDPSQLSSLIDDNTVGVVLTLGNTYTGGFDPVWDASIALAKFEQKAGGRRIPIHVDAAGGGFIEPFSASPNLYWQVQLPQRDFRNPYVDSISASGHKFGMVPAALGWVIWRQQCLPEGMLVRSSYLQMQKTSATLSFSQSGASLLVQYHRFASLGFQGFRDAVQDSLGRAQRMRDRLEKTGWFECVDNHSRLTNEDQAANAQPDMPVVTFFLTHCEKHSLTEESLSTEIFERGFSVPSFRLPGKTSSQMALRIVVRHSTTDALLDETFDLLFHILKEALARQKASEDCHYDDDLHVLAGSTVAGYMSL